MNLPQNVKYIINELKINGHKAYAVGGCVRDMIRGLEPNDWDITTSARPEEIERIFSKTIATGIKHGTITVVITKEAYEVTTFRTESEYEDFRRPKSVEFVSDIEEDLSRRDFTINAMAYNEEDGLIDPFDGKVDLKNGIIRAVGKAEKRFSEDALRMLRAVRFSSRFGFHIEENTYNAIKKCAPLINNISKERIREELTGILLSQNPDYFKLLFDTGILFHILPELHNCFLTPQNCRWHAYDVGTHTMEALKASESNFLVRWALLLHDIGKVDTRSTDNKGNDHFYGHSEVSVKKGSDILTRLKFDNESRDKILKLVKYHDRMIEPREKTVRRSLGQLGEEIFFLLLKVKHGDLNGKGINNSSSVGNINKKLSKEDQILLTIREIANRIIENNDCTSLSKLSINGRDLIELGVKNGPAIGEMLNYALKIVIDEPSKNNKEELIKIVKEKLSKRG